jgi:predicted CoA-binding protein
MKVQQILPWSNYIVKPVNPVMALTITGVNSSTNADKVVKKIPDATSFTPA